MLRGLKPAKAFDPTEGPLGEFFTWWLESGDSEAIRLAIDQAENERDIQSFLQEKPQFLIKHLAGGHGRWVIPQKRLGAEFVTDFLIGEKDSMGYHWCAVELENPRSSMFTKGGNPSKELTHAIRQIQDWRSWLLTNQNYAARAKDEHGLGLTDIVPTIPGLILISRRDNVPTETNKLRRQMSSDLNIQIHSYDFLV